MVFSTAFRRGVVLAAAVAATLLGILPLLGATPPHDAVLAAYRAMLGAKAYRLRIETTDSESGKTYRSLAEVVAPDRLRVVGNGAETIATPEGAFMKGRDGKWKQIHIRKANLLAAYRSQEMVDHFDALNGDFKDLGKASVDGRAARVYEFHCKLHGPGTTTKLWVAAESGRPLEQQVRGGTTTTTERIEYDPTIRIVAPVKTAKPPQG
jgi:hypothetical protein